MREKAVLLVYGEGGHRAQMKRLHALVAHDFLSRGLRLVGVCEAADSIDEFVNYPMPALRDKYNWPKTIIFGPVNLARYAIGIGKIATRYEVVGVVSTGPGLAIIPSLVFKMMGARIVFVETWSRFETSSLTGRVMYRLADRFYFQNKSLEKYYPNGKWGGLL